MLIAVTGASGWIGSRVVSELRAKGFAVRRLVRKASEPTDKLWDMEFPSGSWVEFLNGCDAVVHCAARVHVSEERQSGDEAKFQQINSDATNHLIKAAVTAGVRRFVLASTIAVYDWNQNRPMGEADVIAPASAYARSKLEAEIWLRQSDLDWRICRLATVFGAGDIANFARLAGAMKRRRFFLPGSGTARKSVVPVELAASVLSRAAWDDGWPRVLVNVALPVPPSLGEICTAFTNVCDLPAARRIPIGAMRGIAFAGTACAKFGINLPLNRDILRKLTTDTVVVADALGELFPGRHWPGFSEALSLHRSYYGTL